MSDVNTASNMVKLVMTSDGKVLEVSLTVAKQSKVISRGIDLEDMCVENSKNFPVPIATTERVLKKVIEYCEKHVDAADESKTVTVTEEGSSTIQASRRIEARLRIWDKQFFNEVDTDMLYDLVMAANYLDITDLLDATCQKVADMMKEKSLKGIRKTFNIKNDFTPEEENQILHEHPWAFV